MNPLFPILWEVYLIMTVYELLLAAVALSMDAFAVSVSKGLSLSKVRLRHMILCGIWFGSFQALMPLLGYLAGSLLSSFIDRYSHWLALALLSLIGINMIREAIAEETEEKGEDSSFAPGTMLLLAIATSIDAFAVGATLAFLNVNLIASVTVIGLTTFVISAAGVRIGSIFGSRWEKTSGIAGGVVLILLGIKICLEHYL